MVSTVNRVCPLLTLSPSLTGSVITCPAKSGNTCTSLTAAILPFSVYSELIAPEVTSVTSTAVLFELSSSVSSSLPQPAHSTIALASSAARIRLLLLIGVLQFIIYICYIRQNGQLIKLLP